MLRGPPRGVDEPLEDQWLFCGVRAHWQFDAKAAGWLLERLALPQLAGNARRLVFQAFAVGGCMPSCGDRTFLRSEDFDLDKVKAISFNEATLLQQLLVAAYGEGSIFPGWMLGADSGDALGTLLAIAHSIRKSHLTMTANIDWWPTPRRPYENMDHLELYGGDVFTDVDIGAVSILMEGVNNCSAHGLEEGFIDEAMDALIKRVEGRLDLKLKNAKLAQLAAVQAARLSNTDLTSSPAPTAPTALPSTMGPSTSTGHLAAHVSSHHVGSGQLTKPKFAPVIPRPTTSMAPTSKSPAPTLHGKGTTGKSAPVQPSSRQQPNTPMALHSKSSLVQPAHTLLFSHPATDHCSAPTDARSDPSSGPIPPPAPSNPKAHHISSGTNNAHARRLVTPTIPNNRPSNNPGPSRSCPPSPCPQLPARPPSSNNSPAAKPASRQQPSSRSAARPCKEQRRLVREAGSDDEEQLGSESEGEEVPCGEPAELDDVDMTEYWSNQLAMFDELSHPLHSEPDLKDPLDKRPFNSLAVCGDDGLLHRFPEKNWMQIAQAVEATDDEALVEQLVEPLLIVMGLPHDDVIQGTYARDNLTSWVSRCRIFLRSVLVHGGKKSTVKNYVPKGVTLVKDMMENHNAYLNVMVGDDLALFKSNHLVINGAAVALFFRRLASGKVVVFDPRCLRKVGRPSFKQFLAAFNFFQKSQFMLRHGTMPTDAEVIRNDPGMASMSAVIDNKETQSKLDKGQDPGRSIPSPFTPAQFRVLVNQFIGTATNFVKLMEGFMYGFMFMASYTATQRGDHLRHLLWCMSALVELRDVPDGKTIDGAKLNVITFVMPHSKITKGHNVDPMSIARHRDPFLCPVSWLAMFVFIKFFLLDHGMPRLLEGPQCYFRDRVVNLDPDRTVPVAGPRHVKKMSGILKHISTQCNLVTHLGRKCGALLLQQLGVAVRAIAHHGGWDRQRHMVALCYAVMPEPNTVSVSCGFGDRSVYHIPRADINPMRELQHEGLQKLFREDDPWLAVENLLEDAKEMNASRRKDSDKQFCAEKLAEVLSYLREVFWQDLPFWMAAFPHLPMWQHSVFQNHNAAISHLCTVITTHHDNVERSRAWTQKHLGYGALVKEVGLAREDSRHRILHRGDLTPMPVRQSGDWKMADQSIMNLTRGPSQLPTPSTPESAPSSLGSAMPPAGTGGVDLTPQKAAMMAAFRQSFEYLDRKIDMEASLNAAALHALAEAVKTSAVVAASGSATTSATDTLVQELRSVPPAASKTTLKSMRKSKVLTAGLVPLKRRSRSKAQVPWGLGSDLPNSPRQENGQVQSQQQEHEQQQQQHQQHQHQHQHMHQHRQQQQQQQQEQQQQQQQQQEQQHQHQQQLGRQQHQGQQWWGQQQEQEQQQQQQQQHHRHHHHHQQQQQQHQEQQQQPQQQLGRQHHQGHELWGQQQEQQQQQQQLGRQQHQGQQRQDQQQDQRQEQQEQQERRDQQQQQRQSDRDSREQQLQLEPHLARKRAQEQEGAGRKLPPVGPGKVLVFFQTITANQVYTLTKHAVVISRELQGLLSKYRVPGMFLGDAPSPAVPVRLDWASPLQAYTWTQLVREFLVAVPDTNVGVTATIAPIILLEQPALKDPSNHTVRLWRSGETTKAGVGKRMTLLVALDCRLRGKPRNSTDTGAYSPMSFEQAVADLHSATLQHRLAQLPPSTSNKSTKPPKVTLSTINRYLTEAKVPGGAGKVGWAPTAYVQAVPEIFSLRRADCVLRTGLQSGDNAALL